MNIYTVFLAILPALAVLFTAFVLLDKMLKNENARRNFELQKNALPVVTPVRLRAYERLMLLLDRTNPEKLILTNIKPAMTCLELQTALTAALRQEFSHNAAQQIYISLDTWNTIALVEQSVLNLINLSASKCPPAGDATVLAQGIIEIYTSTDNNPTDVATVMLKEEVKRLF